jgi:pilus assembly protein FimV
VNHRQLTLSTALALALASSGAPAMGLGQLQVKSGLNQPLVAEIPIISATAAELEQLDVRLASPEAFARVGLDQPGELTANLQFSVGKNTRGQPVIRVTTPTRFNEPLLSFLIEAQWGKGVVTREYTALIDPPYIAPAIVKPMQTPAIAAVPVPAAVPTPAPILSPAAPIASVPDQPVPTPAPVAPTRPLPAAPEPVATTPLPEPAYVPPPSAYAPPPAPEPAPPPAVVADIPPAPAYVPPPPAPEPEPLPPAAPEPAPPPAPVAATPPAAAPEPVPAPAEPQPTPAKPDSIGPVRQGQTLSGLAAGLGDEAGVSLNQMMVALLRANPDAFDADNVNRLRSGSVLRVPGQDEVTQLSAAEAAVLVRQQANSWRRPRAAVPQPVETPAPAEPTPPREVAEAPKPAPKPAAPVEPAPKPSDQPAPAPETPVAVAPKVAKAPRRPASRLEIVPPAGDARARGAQSGAAAGAGGTELRAELVQAREDLAAKSSEVGDLQSRLSDLEKQQADRQRLIDLQNSQLKQLQDRLAQMEAEKARAPAVAPVAATPAASRTPASAAPAAVSAPAPWYLNPFVLGSALVVLLGAIVLGLRRRRPGVSPGGSRLSDDEALRASMAKTREAGERIRKEPAAAVLSPLPPADPELQARLDAVQQRPQDLDAQVSLLRLYHARGDALHYEQAAQAMRAQVPSTLDPHWREAVIMGAALLPGHALFGQAGWNSPRFDPEAGRPAATPVGASSPASAPAAPVSRTPLATALPLVDPSTVRVFDPPADYDSALHHEAPLIRDEPDLSELNLDDHATVFGNAFGEPPTDIHRSEAELQSEDQGSATRIELAKAYLDIGDVDGARSMLEEVLIEGGPGAKAEAGRILRDLP